jgi:hypothetical protein
MYFQLLHLRFFPPPSDMISQLFVLYKNPTIPQDSSSVLPAEIDPREVFMKAALKYVLCNNGQEVLTLSPGWTPDC